MADDFPIAPALSGSGGFSAMNSMARALNNLYEPVFKMQGLIQDQVQSNQRIAHQKKVAQDQLSLSIMNSFNKQFNDSKSEGQREMIRATAKQYMGGLYRSGRGQVAQLGMGMLGFIDPKVEAQERYRRNSPRPVMPEGVTYETNPAVFGRVTLEQVQWDKNDAHIGFRGSLEGAPKVDSVSIGTTQEGEGGGTIEHFAVRNKNGTVGFTNSGDADLKVKADVLGVPLNTVLKEGGQYVVTKEVQTAYGPEKVDYIYDVLDPSKGKYRWKGIGVTPKFHVGTEKEVAAERKLWQDVTGLNSLAANAKVSGAKIFEEFEIKRTDPAARVVSAIHSFYGEKPGTVKHEAAAEAIRRNFPGGVPYYTGDPKEFGKYPWLFKSTPGNFMKVQDKNGVPRLFIRKPDGTIRDLTDRKLQTMVTENGVSGIYRDVATHESMLRRMSGMTWGEHDSDMAGPGSKQTTLLGDLETAMGKARAEGRPWKAMGIKAMGDFIHTGKFLYDETIGVTNEMLWSILDPVGETIANITMGSEKKE